MTIGKFIDALPQGHMLSDDERLQLSIGIYFMLARDQYGIPLICFCDPCAVSRFVKLIRGAGYKGHLNLGC